MASSFDDKPDIILSGELEASCNVLGRSRVDRIDRIVPDGAISSSPDC